MSDELDNLLDDIILEPAEWHYDDYVGAVASIKTLIKQAEIKGRIEALKQGRKISSNYYNDIATLKFNKEIAHLTAELEQGKK